MGDIAAGLGRASEASSAGVRRDVEQLWVNIRRRDGPRGQNAGNKNAHTVSYISPEQCREPTEEEAIPRESIEAVLHNS